MFDGRYAAIALVLVLTFSGSSFAKDDKVLGRWYGEMRQVNVDGEQRYPMTLLLSGNAGESNYTTLNCGGQLTRLASANGMTVYSETISSGRFDPSTGDGCIDGFVVVQRHRSKLILEWSGSHAGRPYVATAILSMQQP